MEPRTGTEVPVRLLGLGNEILADDAFGILAAREAARRFGAALEVVCSSSSGLDLLDALLGAGRLLVVDTIVTGTAPPGTLYVLTEDVLPAASASFHTLGIFEVLAAARALGLPVASEVLILGVEPADLVSFGAPMHASVAAAIPTVLDTVGRYLADNALT